MQWTSGVGYLARAPLQRRFQSASTTTPSLDPVDALVEEEDLALLEDEDAAALVPDSPSAQQELCTVHLSICYSPTYSMPVLWFEAHKASGTPLSLDEVLHSTLFHSSALSVASTVTDAGTAPFLSQADHPATGRPSWFLHPCETEGMVREVLQAGYGDGNPHEAAEGQRWEERWFATWLTVVGGVVDLRE